jgi:hypothetical protein
MKTRILFLTLVAAFSPSAQAYCSGSGSYYTCNDASGNNYNVSKFGNQTQVHGYNYNTGNTWSQNSSTVGNTTYHNGIVGNGNAWSGTTQTYGNTTTHSGIDSQGNYYLKTCGPLGCF